MSNVCRTLSKLQFLARWSPICLNKRNCTTQHIALLPNSVVSDACLMYRRYPMLIVNITSHSDKPLLWITSSVGWMRHRLNVFFVIRLFFDANHIHFRSKVYRALLVQFNLLSLVVWLRPFHILNCIWSLLSIISVCHIFCLSNRDWKLVNTLISKIFFRKSPNIKIRNLFGARTNFHHFFNNNLTICELLIKCVVVLIVLLYVLYKDQLIVKFVNLVK